MSNMVLSIGIHPSDNSLTLGMMLGGSDVRKTDCLQSPGHPVNKWLYSRNKVK